ncbi:MAG: FxsA family protein [Nocardioidaceae bacterium]
MRSTGMKKRSALWWALLMAFIVVPILEIYVIIQIGQAIGPWWTVLLLIADSIFGAWLMKREGRNAWGALRDALQMGRMPAKELADGALILIGGTLMLAPGFLSDVAALFLILPVTRPLARLLLTSVIARRLTFVYQPTPTATRGETTATASQDVVLGEVVDD